MDVCIRLGGSVEKATGMAELGLEPLSLLKIRIQGM